jgi:glycosidase
MKKKRRILVSIGLCILLLLTTGIVSVASNLLSSTATTTNSIKVHYYCAEGQPNIYYWNSLPENIQVNWPGVKMTSEGEGWYVYEFTNKNKINIIFNLNGTQTADLTRNSGEWWYKNGSWTSTKPGDPQPVNRTDFRDETIYFVMTTRFYDGETGNNEYCWRDEELKNVANNDPGWRGDFQGLIDKLDYIKALGFSAIWITPVVQNASDLDYHGYHANNFAEVDPRYESDGATYQDLIDAFHVKNGVEIHGIPLFHTCL